MRICPIPNDFVPSFQNEQRQEVHTSIFQDHKGCLYGRSQESAAQSPYRGPLGTPFPDRS